MVNILIFFLAFFLDFFELSFIVIPLIGPVAEKLGIDLVWFGVLLAVNMQTSFMHPPFGFALFYLRSVAPHDDYTDRVTNKRLPKVTTGQIYWGAVPFVLIQVLMVGLIIAFPNLVSGGLAKKADVDLSNIQIDAPKGKYSTDAELAPALEAPARHPARRPRTGARKTRWRPSSARCSRISRRSSSAAPQTRQKAKAPPADRRGALVLAARTGQPARAPVGAHSFCDCMKSSKLASVKRNHRLASRRNAE